MDVAAACGRKLGRPNWRVTPNRPEMKPTNRKWSQKPLPHWWKGSRDAAALFPHGRDARATNELTTNSGSCTASIDVIKVTNEKAVSRTGRSLEPMSDKAVHAATWWTSPAFFYLPATNERPPDSLITRQSRHLAAPATPWARLHIDALFSPPFNTTNCKSRPLEQINLEANGCGDASNRRMQMSCKRQSVVGRQKLAL